VELHVVLARMHHCPCELHVSFIRLDVIIESGHVIHAQVATEIDAYDGPYRKDSM